MQRALRNITDWLTSTGVVVEVFTALSASLVILAALRVIEFGWVEALTVAVAVAGFVVGLVQTARLRAQNQRTNAALEALTGPVQGVRRTPVRTPVLPSPRPTARLTAELREHQCVLFVGAELAVLGGMPHPARIISALLPQTRLAPVVVEELQRQLGLGDTDLVSDVLASEVSPGRLTALIRDVSAGLQPDFSSSVFHELRRLPFAGVITDMWYDLPEQLFDARDPIVVSAGNVDRGPGLLRDERFFVAHINGSLSHPDAIRLPRTGFTEISEDLEFDSFVRSVLRTHTVLFLGAPEQTILRITDASASRGPGHIALLPWEPDLGVRSQRLAGRGVEILTLDPERQEAQLEEFVRALSRSTVVRREGIRRRAPSAQQLRLRNIGPFEEVTLPLHPHATVLLGDNASGKSSILRALALALSGEDGATDAAAGNLLRAGTRSGEVELTFDGERYEASLQRGKRGVSVRAPTSPVSAGVWLGLGFPPLRGVAQRSLQGPGPEPDGDPSAEDVLPLATNALDERLSDVEQWILNLALRAEGRSDAARLAANTLDRFFEVVAAMNPGVAFSFAHIDRESWRVMINTDDGLLSVDQLSRGMTAVLGWVGVLVQRLVQVNEAGDLDRTGALLLVDEVDLHLHPAWQRRIVPLIREQFPAVQLVLSTHSPLVVGSLTDGCLIHLHRAAGTVHANVVTEDFAGWRADQILTSTAFDLTTTRDRETEAALQQYADLLAARGSEASVEELGSWLRERLPLPMESAISREAADYVRAALDDRLAALPAHRRQLLADEAERYLQKLRARE
jgi:hypothetical protein